MKNIILLFFSIISLLFSRQIHAEFESENPWLMGMPWVSGIAFDNGIAYGLGLYGNSTISINEAIDIDIVFSEHPDSTSVSMVFSATDMAVEMGLGIFPGSAWDLSNPNNPRRLNICFFEQNGGNYLWDPTSLSGMDLEYLLIMNSDYDSSGETYQNSDILASDVHYFCWLRRGVGETWFSSQPATLHLTNSWEFSNFTVTASESSIFLEWTHENSEVESSEISSYLIKNLQLSDSTISMVSVSNLINEYYWDGLTLNEEYQFQVIGLSGLSEVIWSETVSAIPSMIADNTALISNWNLANTVMIGASTYNDIWGYTDDNGTEYALIGGWDGTYIVDISSNPIEPQQTGFIPGSFSTHRDIKVSGNHMYVGTEANRMDPYLFAETGEVDIIPQGIQVVDISDPNNAVLINEWGGIVQSHNLMEADGYLYVIGSYQYSADNGAIQSWGLDDLIILNLSDPTNPWKIGGWSGEYLHDVCVNEDILYGMAIYSDRVYAFDISDKSNPQVITFWDGIPHAHACWPSDDGLTLFTASETSFGHILSYDVSDLNNINLLDEWYPENGEEWSVHNIFYRNGFIFASHYAFGLQIIDVDDPANMSTVGFYDTYTTNPAGLYDGAWGAYPYFDSDLIIVSDRSNGLFVIEYLESNWSHEVLLGDLNLDQIVDILDIIIIINYIINEIPLTDEQLSLGDLYEDGIINIQDIILIINLILGE